MDGWLPGKAGQESPREPGRRGTGAIDLQHELGKLTARERIEHLADPGSFEEMGSLVRDFTAREGREAVASPADGVVMGTIEINGRKAMVYSMDFTGMSGSFGDQGIWKIAELVQRAGQEQMPVIGIFDSGIVRSVALYKQAGMFEGDPHISLVMGVASGQPAKPEWVPPLKNEMLPGTHWQVICVGRKGASG